MQTHGLRLLVYVSIALTCAVSAIAVADGISKDCVDGKECLIDVPGAVCADGTQSFITLTKRPGAKHLLVYMSGGGACWSKTTCNLGYAQTLTRKERPMDWDKGSGIHDSTDQANPFAKDFNVVTIPYCTGDAYTGNRQANYGSEANPYIIRHRGYANVVKQLAAVKAMLPTPEKAVLLGCSAGGIGAYYHMRNFAQAFPGSRKFVISDAGTPFKPPYLKKENYEAIMKAWGADTTLPAKEAEMEEAKDFASLIRYNSKRFSDIRFAFIDGYRDRIMTFFAWSVGSPSPFTAVKQTIIDVADNYVGRDNPNARVFYTDSAKHCHTGEALSQVTSEGTNLDDWFSGMLGDAKGWDNVRPDLKRPIDSVEDEMRKHRSEQTLDLSVIRNEYP